MKTKVKDILKDSFGSLISNDRALSAAKRNPLWLTIIIFILSFLLPVVPMTVFYANQNGSTIIKANSYAFEKTIPAFALEMKKQGIDYLKFNENKELDIPTANTDPIYTYKNSVTGYEELRVYAAGYSTPEEERAFITQIREYKQLIAEADESDNTENLYVCPSFIVFFNNAFAFQVYIPGTDTLPKTMSNLSGDYKSFKAGEDLIELLTTVKDFDFAAPQNEIEYLTQLSNSKYANGIYANFKTLLNTTYKTAQNRALLFGSLIFAGIYLGLSLIMALVIFLLTRGKKNPFNYMSFWMTFKIESWIALAPALIGLVFGLFFGADITIKMLLFIAPLGLRSMVLMTKQLRPM